MVGYRPEDSYHLSEVELSLAGAVSGAVTRACSQPLDVLKIRFQLQHEPVRGSEAINSKYRGIVQAYRLVVAEEGLAALWKGHVPAQALSLIYGAVQFSVFERLTRAASENGYKASSPMVHFTCGAASSIAASVASHPVDVIRTRLIAQGEPKLYRGVHHALGSLVKYEGLFALYRGLTPSLMLVAPQMGAMFAFYNILTDLWREFAPEGSKEKPFVCGALAGVGSKTLVYPLDLAKKRLQIRGFEHARRGFGKVVVFRGLLHVLWHTACHEGIGALFKGLWPSVIKAAVTTGLHLSVYVHVCNILIAISRR